MGQPVPISFRGVNINDVINYVSLFDFSYSLTPAESVSVERSGARPLTGGKKLPSRKRFLGVAIEDMSNVDALRTQLQQIFATELETPGILLVSNDDGSNRRYLEMTCDDFPQLPGSHGTMFMATLVVHKEDRFQDETEVAVVMNIASSGQTLIVNNSGEDDAYPRFVIEATSAKLTDNPHKRFVTLRYNASDAAKKYPVDITNGSLDTQIASTYFDSATGDDVRVLVNGKEVDFWIINPNTASTKIWILLDFEPEQTATLNSSLDTSPSLEAIVVNEDISSFPSSGILEIDSELFIYTGTNVQQKRFTGITRASKETAVASHSNGATVRWIQHDIVIAYGSSGLTAYVPNDDNKPAFNLTTSTNLSWVYSDFAEADGLRAASWGFIDFGNTLSYGASEGGVADPFAVLGIKTVDYPAYREHSGAWGLFVPVGITGANFTNGKKYAFNWPGRWTARIRSSSNGADYVDEYSIPVPGADSWDAWSQNVSSLTSGTRHVHLWLGTQTFSPGLWGVEAGDVTITLDSSNTPTLVVGGEKSNYDLSATITNNTTDHALQVTYQTKLNNKLEVDTYARTVTDLSDGSSQFQARNPLGGARKHWLLLQPGDNEIQFDDVGTAGVTMTIYFRRRYFN